MYTFNTGTCYSQFHTNDFRIIWRINCNASAIGSNTHCDVIKQPGETVSAAIVL